jgi:hypothetical protein
MTADQEIANTFSFVEQMPGARRIRCEYHAAHFGNAIVEYDSPRLRVRVTKDRGAFLCDFASPEPPVEWFDLEVVFRVLGEDRTIDALIAESFTSLESIGRAVEDNLEPICERFGEAHYADSRKRFHEHLEARVRWLLNRK